MHIPPVSELAAPLDQSTAPATRLSGRWLLVVRVAWAALSVGTLGLFVLSLPASLAQLETVCTGAFCFYSNGRLTPGVAQALEQGGLSIGGYAASVLALSVASLVVFFGVGGLLFWRRSDDWMALLVSLFLMTFGVNLITQAQQQHTALVVPFAVVTSLGWVSFNLLLYLFPTGQFVPRWTRWLAVGMGAFDGAFSILLNVFPAALPSFPPWIISAVFAGLACCGLVAQIYRYVRVSGPVQRQQTKWVFFGATAAVVGILGRFVVPNLIVPSLPTASACYFLVTTYLYPLGSLLLPLTLGIAILRYRLWDIDMLINKALVYGGLSGLLGALYVGLIIGLESLAGLFGGQTASNPVVLVISTLAIAALFLPVRRRIQAIIDRRFYRKKYDAEKVLAAFSATLCHETDLEQICEQLLMVVNETMHSAQVSLWLRPPERNPMEPLHHPERHGSVPIEPSRS